MPEFDADYAWAECMASVGRGEGGRTPRRREAAGTGKELPIPLSNSSRVRSSLLQEGKVQNPSHLLSSRLLNMYPIWGGTWLP